MSTGHPGPFALGGAAGTGEKSAESTLVCGDILSLPFCDGAFDACLAECVLSLTADLGKALRDIFRVLAPEGLFLVTDLTLRGGTAVLLTVLSWNAARAAWPAH